MFQFPALAHYIVCYAFSIAGFPIRIHPDQFVFANPRIFSQLSASFFADRSPGILHSPFVTFSLESSLEIVVPNSY